MADTWFIGNLITDSFGLGRTNPCLHPSSPGSGPDSKAMAHTTASPSTDLTLRSRLSNQAGRCALTARGGGRYHPSCAIQPGELTIPTHWIRQLWITSGGSSASGFHGRALQRQL